MRPTPDCSVIYILSCGEIYCITAAIAQQISITHSYPEVMKRTMCLFTFLQHLCGPRATTLIHLTDNTILVALHTAAYYNDLFAILVDILVNVCII